MHAVSEQRKVVATNVNIDYTFGRSHSRTRFERGESHRDERMEVEPNGS